MEDGEADEEQVHGGNCSLGSNVSRKIGRVE